MNRYAKGILYVWTIPDNFNDLYRLPVQVTGALRAYVMGRFPVQVDGPAQVALFAYDNNTFIVESYLPTTADVEISIPGAAAKLRNLVTDEILTSQTLPPEGNRAGQIAREKRSTFPIQIAPHSYVAFQVDSP
jgi:hypothetical protein